MGIEIEETTRIECDDCNADLASILGYFFKAINTLGGEVILCSVCMRIRLGLEN